MSHPSRAEDTGLVSHIPQFKEISVKNGKNDQSGALDVNTGQDSSVA